MPNTEVEARLFTISRLLTPENQADLLTCVRLAYTAESSVRKKLGITSIIEGEFNLDAQKYPFENSGV